MQDQMARESKWGGWARVARPVFAVAVVLLGVLCLWSSQGVVAPVDEVGSMDDGGGSDGRGEAVSVNDETWVARAAESPVRVAFVKPADHTKAVREIETRGLLSGRDKVRMRNHLVKAVELSYGAWTAECSKKGSGPNGEKTPRDAADELHLLLMALRREAHLKLFDREKYLTVDRGEASELRWPAGYLVSTVFGYKVDGRRVDVVFGVSPDEDSLKPILEEIRVFEGMATEDQIRVFNELMLEERRRRYEDSLAAVAALRGLSQLGLSEEERARRQGELVARILPGEWHIEPGSYYARPRD